MAEKDNDKKKKKDKPKEKPLRYFDIYADGITKIQVKYTVLAKDENEAIQMVKSGRASPKHISPPKIHFGIFTELSVFLAGTINKLLQIRLR